MPQFIGRIKGKNIPIRYNTENPDASVPDEAAITALEQQAILEEKQRCSA